MGKLRANLSRSHTVTGTQWGSAVGNWARAEPVRLGFLGNMVPGVEKERKHLVCSSQQNNTWSVQKLEPAAWPFHRLPHASPQVCLRVSNNHEGNSPGSPPPGTETHHSFLSFTPEVDTTSSLSQTQNTRSADQTLSQAQVWRYSCALNHCTTLPRTLGNRAQILAPTNLGATPGSATGCAPLDRSHE